MRATPALIIATLFLATACGDDPADDAAQDGQDDGSPDGSADGAADGADGAADGADGAADGADGGAEAFDPQVPPADAEQMALWLARYEAENWEADWVCESEPTAKTAGAAAIHVHNDADGKNRVCNNQRLAASQVGAPVPRGSAALKYVGDAIYVEVKTADESDAGQNWYWYAPGGSVAGQGLEACIGCHGAAGSDADHPGLGDYVYFQVR